MKKVQKDVCDEQNQFRVGRKKIALENIHVEGFVCVDRQKPWLKGDVEQFDLLVSVINKDIVLRKLRGGRQTET